MTLSLCFVDGLFTRNIIHSQIDHFHTLKRQKEVNQSLAVARCRENMVDAQQALSLPIFHLKMVLRHFHWLFKSLPLFPIEEN
jgi:hypothetical protein